MILTIGKKLVNLLGLPYMPPNMVNLVYKRLRAVNLIGRTSLRLTFATHFDLIIFIRWRAHARLCHASSFRF